MPRTDSCGSWAEIQVGVPWQQRWGMCLGFMVATMPSQRGPGALADHPPDRGSWVVWSVQPAGGGCLGAGVGEQRPQRGAGLASALRPGACLSPAAQALRPGSVTWGQCSHLGGSLAPLLAAPGAAKPSKPRWVERKQGAAGATSIRAPVFRRGGSQRGGSQGVGVGKMGGGRGMTEMVKEERKEVGRVDGLETRGSGSVSA